MASETTPSPALYYRDPNLASRVVCWFCLKHRCGGIRDDSETVDESSCDLCGRDPAAVQKEIDEERKREIANQAWKEKNQREHLKIVRGQLLALFKTPFDPLLPKPDPVMPLPDDLVPALSKHLFALCNSRTGELGFINYSIADSDLVMLAKYLHPKPGMSHCIVRWRLDGTDERRVSFNNLAHAERTFRQEVELDQPWHFWFQRPQVIQIVHDEWKRLDGNRDDERQLNKSVYAALKKICRLLDIQISQQWFARDAGEKLLAEEVLENSENIKALLGEKMLKLRSFYPYYGHFSPKEKEIELTPAEYLYRTWLYACSGGASQTGPSASYLEPSELLGKREAKRVRLIRQVLGELGKNRNDDKTGWKAVRLAELCKAIGVPTGGKRYSDLRKLMEDLAACRIVHDDGKRWGNAFRLLGAPTDVPTRQSVRDRQDKIDEILASPQK